MQPASAYTPPTLQDLSDEALTPWVATCVDARKNGATPSEVASLSKVLKRLAPALAAAVAAPSPGVDFEQTLEALGRG